MSVNKPIKAVYTEDARENFRAMVYGKIYPPEGFYSAGFAYRVGDIVWDKLRYLPFFSRISIIYHHSMHIIGTIEQRTLSAM